MANTRTIPTPKLNDDAGLYGSLRAKLERIKTSPLRSAEARTLMELRELDTRLEAAIAFHRHCTAELDKVRRYYNTKPSNDLPFLKEVRELMRLDEPFETTWKKLDQEKLLKYLTLQVWGKDKYIVLDQKVHAAADSVRSLEQVLLLKKTELSDIQSRM